MSAPTDLTAERSAVSAAGAELWPSLLMAFALTSIAVGITCRTSPGTKVSLGGTRFGLRRTWPFTSAA